MLILASQSLRLFLLLGILMSTFAASAQPRKFSGKITNESGEPLVGVTVQLKGGGAATTTTKESGQFEISIPTKSSEILVLSYVGYITKEISIRNLSSIAAVLQLVDKELDDVVVVGYGTQRKRDLTGAVTKVDMGELIKAPVRSFDEALAGRVAGVQVTSTDGQPGSPVSVVIRGNNSITQDNSPLYVVDGFPIEGPNANSINPSDIESIEVLKDASATAIYGARAANGVIIITTKRGRAGKTEIVFSSFYGVQDILNKVDVLSPYEFVRYQFELDSVITKAQYLTGGKTIENYKNWQGVDWQEQVFRKAPIYSNSVSVSGGNSSTKFFLSLSGLKQEGIVKFSGYDRYQGRFKLDHSINSKLKLGMNLNYSALKSYGTIPSSLSNSSSQSSNLMFSVWGYRPITGDSTFDLLNGLDPYFENDLNDSRFNPLETVTHEVRDRYTNTIYGNLSLDYQLSSRLKFKTLFGYTNDADRNEEFNSSKTRAGSPYSSGGRANGINGSFVFNTVNSYVSENTLNYNTKLGKKHTLDAVAGVTFQGVSRRIYGAAASRLPNERLGLAGLDEGTPSKISSSFTQNRLSSFLGRVNYNYAGKYLVTASFRADGSSKFDPNNRWSYFPSGSFGWRFSKERFMKKNKWMSDGKLRISYGLIGNNRISDFAYLSTFNSPVTLAYPFNGSLTSSTVPFTLGNPNLRWETTAQTDLGVDVSLFENRFSITVDLYQKVTRNLLLNADLPPSSGFSAAFKNIGKVQNKGIELSLGMKWFQKGKFNWSTQFNVSANRNKVLGLNDGQEALLSLVNWDNQWRSLPAYIAKVSLPLGLYYGYVWDGLYQVSDFNVNGGVYTLKPNITSNTTTSSARIQPGHIKYKDLNGDLVINDNDKTIIGNANPDWIGGLNNSFKYGNWDLSVFFQFSYGGKLLNANRYVFEGNSGRTLQNQYATVLNRWTLQNQNNEMFVARGDGDKVYSSRVIEDGSYLRLKTAQFGYTLPESVLKRAKIQSLRFYVSAQNLFTWTRYSGFDPEVSAYNSALTPGFDYSVYPRARTTTVGLNLTF